MSCMIRKNYFWIKRESVEDPIYKVIVFPLACPEKRQGWCYVTRDGVTGDGDAGDDTFGDIGDGDTGDHGPFGTAATTGTSSE